MTATFLSLLYLFLIIGSHCPGLAMSQQIKEEEEAGTSCPSPEPVGFTALTPQQLRQEIYSAINSSMAISLRQLEDRLTNNEKVLTSYFILLDEVVRELNSSIHSNEQVLTSYFVLLDEVVRELNSSIHKSQAMFQRLMQVLVDERDTTSSLQGFVHNLDSSLRGILQALSSTFNLTTPPPPFSPRVSLGQSPSMPALSCQQILDTFPMAPSGYYFVAALQPAQFSVNNELLPHVSRVYCSMNHTCGGKEGGGWMRVALINMTNSSHSCPPGENFVEWERSELPRRLCIPRSNDTGCFSHRFPVPSLASGTTKICGRVVAYQNGTPNGFYPFHIETRSTIDDVYMDGISLTHGLLARSHIWTFVAALDETQGHLSACACSNRNQLVSSRVPSFVGHNYFCDTGSKENAGFQFYSDDPLWDGKGCGPFSSCCSLNSPPWFSADLGEFPAGDSIELRVCRDSDRNNENIPFELVELYVK